jgi:SAM-dependent methyltransferase
MKTGAAVYTIVLWFYDFYVLFLTNLLAWRCSTKHILLPFFRANVGPRHMDVGVGTGYFPAKTHVMQRPPNPSHRDSGEWPEKLVLVDLNPNCLEKTAKRLGIPERTQSITADVMQPLPLDKSEKFDSISLMYLLHCVPAAPEEKGAIFANLKPYLKDDGTLFGATVLGQSNKQHNLLASFFLLCYNWTGVFSNLGDSKEHFDAALRAEFEQVDTAVIGSSYIFKAWNPRTTPNIEGLNLRDDRQA